MATTVIRVQPIKKTIPLLMIGGGIGAFYLIFGYLPIEFWILVAFVLVALVVLAFKGESKASVVLDDEGVFDSRLKVGVIRWADIRRIQSFSLYGAEFISLELHNQQAYEARRPAWFRISSKAQRFPGMSSIAISTSGLEMDTGSLLQRLHAGCQNIYQKEAHV